MDKQELDGLVQYVKDRMLEQKQRYGEFATNGDALAAGFWHLIEEGELEEAVDMLEGMMFQSSYRRVAWDGVAGVAASFLRKDSKPLVGLTDWIADYLEGKTKPPTKGAEKLYQRDIMLGVLVDLLISEKGLNPTRNLTAAPESGCDVVGKAMGLEYKSAEKIYLHRKKLEGELSSKDS